MGLAAASGYTQVMSDVRKIKRQLITVLDLLQDPTPEHHQEVREDLLSAHQKLSQMADVNAPTPSKVAVYQDFRLHRTWAREHIESALECLQHLGKTHGKRKKLTSAAEHLQDAYLLI